MNNLIGEVPHKFDKIGEYMRVLHVGCNLFPSDIRFGFYDLQELPYLNFQDRVCWFNTSYNSDGISGITSVRKLLTRVASFQKCQPTRRSH